MPNTAPAAATPAVPNPAALGLVAFGLTTVLLSLINAGVLPAGGEPVVIPLALAYGGLMQVIAGALEVKTGNTFGMTAFFSYGAFWLWFALLLIFAHTGVIDISKAGPTVGVALLLWGVLTLYLWVSTFRLPKILFFIFLTLWVTFALLGLGAVMAMPELTKAGGWLGLVCGIQAIYGSFALVTNATFGRTVLPMGEKPILSA
jgi:succinate-acetate transporter protein